MSILKQHAANEQKNLDHSGTRNRDDIVALGKQPREGTLAGHSIVFLTNFLQSDNEFEDIRGALLGMPSLKLKRCDQQANVPRHSEPKTTLFKIIRGFILTSESASQWRICDNSDAKLSRSFEKNFAIFNIESEWRIFDLKCGNWVHCMCATESCSRTLKQT
jgi:hypothetical protein